MQNVLVDSAVSYGGEIIRFSVLGTVGARLSPAVTDEGMADGSVGRQIRM